MSKIESLIEVSELIVKSNTGKITEEESKRLSAWLNESERNRVLFEKIHNGNNLMERSQLIRESDTSGAWLNVSERIGEKSKNLLILNILKYAAILLFPILGVTAYLLNQPDKDIAEPLVHEAKIEPGSKSAVLVLDNGRNINLGDLDSLKLKEHDGTMIFKDQEFLSYSKNEEGKSLDLKNTLIVPRGGEYCLYLSDSTKVYVNSMSKLDYPVQFSANTREVSLEGEACFFVKKDAKRPFVVNVDGVKIEVLGTTFNVNAYGEESKVITTLVEGKIKLNLREDKEQEFIMSPNDQVVYNKKSKGATIEKVNARDYVTWTNGIYTFRDQSLGEIMKTLSRWYDFNYWFEYQVLKDIRFEGGLNKYESIEPILDIIGSTEKVNVEIKNNNILFKRNK